MGLAPRPLLGTLSKGQGNMETGKQDLRETVTFHLIKAPQFHSQRVDGAVGSVTPGGVSLVFFIERGPIPKVVTHEVAEDGSLGALVSAEGKTGIVRELQTGIILDFRSARSLHDQLGRILEDLDKEDLEPEEEAQS